MALPLLPKPDLIKILKDRHEQTGQFIIRELTRAMNAPYPQVEATNVQGRINGALKRLDAFDAAWTRTAVTRAYSDAIRRTRVQLELIGASRPRGSALGKAHGENMARFTARILGDLKKANASTATSAQAVLGLIRSGFTKASQIQEFNMADLQEAPELFDQWAAEAVAKGEARAKLSLRIIEHLRGLIASGDFVEIEGSDGKIRHYQVGYYAEVVARTTMREAQTTATKALCDDYENDLVEFSTHNKPCDECAGLEGMVFSISGTHPDYPPLTPDEEPPLHPNCEHSITPTSDVAIRAREAEQ